MSLVIIQVAVFRKGPYACVSNRSLMFIVIGWNENIFQNSVF